MHGKQSNGERSYLGRRTCGRGIKSLRDVYKETEVRVACYMAMSDSPWTTVACTREVANEYCSVRREAEEVMEETGKTLILGKDQVKLDGEQLSDAWTEVWAKLKVILKTQTDQTATFVYIYREENIECPQSSTFKT